MRPTSQGGRSFRHLCSVYGIGATLLIGLLSGAEAGALVPPQVTTTTQTSGDAVGASSNRLGLGRLLQQAGRDRLLRIVAFGSSSTEGVGATSPTRAYPAQLQLDLAQAMPMLSIQVVNRGIGGEDVDDMMARLQSDVLSRRPDLVIWQTGSNDPMRNVPLDRFATETRAGIAAIRAAGAKVMLMEPQWCPKLDATTGATSFRDSVRQIGAELGVPVIRRSDLMHRWVAEGRISREDMIAPDGLHMTDRGYALLARDVAQEILKDAAPAAPVAAVAPSVVRAR
jgi:lysophospholipase L1-like esterase